jgi:hypothetical protein
MAIDPVSVPETTAFLVERYLAPAAAGTLAASVSRVALLCGDPRGAHHGVQYLHSVYLPTEDTCFCLFRGPSAAAVREVNREGGFALDRITAAVLVHPGSNHPRPPSETSS